MGNKGFYHLFSDGFRTEVLFEDKQSFISGMNITALCFLKCHVKILAFCLMDNHIHFILYGTMDDCKHFMNKFIHRYGIWYSNRYSGKKSETIDFDIKIIEDEKYLLNSISYVLRNSIAAGYSFCVEDYQWSSGGLYFRMPERLNNSTSGWKKTSDISLREQRRIFQTQDELPSEWKITPEGYIWPGNYVDYKEVEKLFRTPKSFIYFMGHSKEEDINIILGINESVFLPDMELREKAVTHCFILFQTTNLRCLDAQRRIRLAKELRKEYRCSAKQIARIIHLDPRFIKELV